MTETVIIALNAVGEFFYDLYFHVKVYAGE